MTTSESSRGARGGAITLSGQVIKALLQALSVVILSRLLGPDDFGLIAMVTVAVYFGELVLDFGLTAAALRAPRLSKRQASNLFWLNSALGLGLCAIMVIAAPVIASVYSDPRLTVIAQVTGTTLLFRGLQAQLQVQLARNHRYVTLTATDIASHATGFTFAVVGAAIGWGYWALVLQLVSTAASLFLFRIATAKWLPLLPSRNSDSLPLVRSGMNYAASQILTFAAGNVDSFIIGARFGSVSLGYYNRAFQIMTVPLTQTLGPLTVVAVPTLTAAKQKRNNLDTLLRRLQTLVSFPIAIGFSIAAGSASALVPLVLGAQWTPSVLIFQILAIGGALRALSHINYWMFLVLARSSDLLKVNLVTKSLTVVAVLVASVFSVEAVAIAYAVSLLINWPVNLLWLRQVANIDWRPYLVDGIRFLIVGIVLCMLTLLAGLIDMPNVLLQALIQIAAGVIGFAILFAVSKTIRNDIRVITDTARSIFTRS